MFPSQPPTDDIANMLRYIDLRSLATPDRGAYSLLLPTAVVVSHWEFSSGSCADSGRAILPVVTPKPAVDPSRHHRWRPIPKRKRSE
jgi:hypothetical protein